MASQDGEDIYATLLLNDNYLPGALVLGHSLRDAGTTKKLAVLVTLDTVSAEAVTQLKTVYDYVISVPRIRNKTSPANLDLMSRPDLHSAFTKINLWKQTQYRKIVYIDADVVAYRAPDELFELPDAFAAAPDIGWPDLFNTGVMVITPEAGEYYALMAMADRGISFDGADQGLLNMHFKNNYHRLPFTYNVTPSAHYQYLPAYRHFQSSINMVHFIGADKPWLQGRGASTGSPAYDEMVGQWWAIYDRHYRQHSPRPDQQETLPPPPEIVQYFVKGEFQPRVTRTLTKDEPSLYLGSLSYGQQSETLPPPQRQLGAGTRQDQEHHYQNEDHDHNERVPMSTPTPFQEHSSPPPFASPTFPGEEPTAETREDQVSGQRPGMSQPPAPEHHEPYRHPTEKSWDAQWQPPPTNAKPEALDFPQTHYEMSQDATPYVPPKRYPSPPRGMWYEVPKVAPAPVYERPPPIFPWEVGQQAPTRVFIEDLMAPPQEPGPAHDAGARNVKAQPGPLDLHSQHNYQATKLADSSMVAGSPSVDLRTEPTTPIMPFNTARAYPTSDPWAAFTRTNAWDEVPQIERYVDAMSKHHRRVRSRPQTPNSLRLGGTGSGFGSMRGGAGSRDVDVVAPSPQRGRGLKVTDFPSEVERPSLPVTPAPVRRTKFWGGDGPGFGSDEAGAGHDQRQLPAAEGVPQQTDWDPAVQLEKLALEQSALLLKKLGNGDEERVGADQRIGTIAMRPLPVKPEALLPSAMANGKKEKLMPVLADIPIQEPAYHGPGVAFEKDETYPAQDMAVALPSEEELDVLDT